MNTITIDQIGCLIVRGISLLLALGVLSSAAMIVQIITAPANTDAGMARLLFLSPNIINALLAVFTWVWAPQIAKKMLPVAAESPAPFTMQNILVVMLVAVGFFLLQDAVKYTVSMVAHIMNVVIGTQKLQLADIVSTLMVLGISVSLIFTPQGVAKMIKYARITGGEK